MSLSDLKYFQQRVAVERAQAKTANRPGVAAIHESLARGYELLVRDEKSRLYSRLVTAEPEQQAVSG